MSSSRTLCKILVWFAAVGLCFPTHALAVDDDARYPAVASATTIRFPDVELRPGGLLVGQLFNADAQPMAGTDVVILSNGQVIASTRTDSRGMFAATGLRGGVHQISSKETAQLCRVWAPGTAPPSSVASLRIVAGTDVTRGQWGRPPSNGYFNKAKSWATNPFVIGGILATAVAIPVAINNADDPKS